MGNCLKSCFGSIRAKSKKNYFTGRYKEYNVGIEFESLIEDDLAQQSELSSVTNREKDHLLKKRYSDLVQDQKRRDAEIDAELQRQEENVRLEEEAYIAAKRESARAAHQARVLEQQRSKPIANGTAKSSWLGDNENEWHVAGGEDDFEMFLESVKARSQSVRANGIASNPYNSSGTSSVYNNPLIANINSKGNSGGSVGTQEASSEQMESDSDFEPEFVGAETTPEQILIMETRFSSQSPPKLTQTMPAVTINVPQSNKSQVVVQVHDRKTASREMTKAAKMTNPVTPSANVQSEEVSESESVAVTMVLEKSQKPVVSVAADNTNTAQATTESSTKTTTAAIEDDPFDFDKFLEELDLEG